MYLPVIEPIDRLCTEAIDRARSGDISTARELIDRVRTMRSRLSRSVHNHRFESIENWINNSGLDDKDVLRYREQASALSKKLDIIGEWISPFIPHEGSLSNRSADICIYNSHCWPP